MTQKWQNPDRSAEFVKRLTAAQFGLQAHITFLVGNAEDAKDILQETNLTLWKEAEKYDFEREFLPWAKTVAAYQVKTFRTLQSRDRLLFDEELLARVAIEPEVEHDMHRMLEALERCMDKMTLSQKALLRSRYFQGLAVNAIAKTLKCSADSVSMLLYRIRDRLGKCVESAMREEVPHAR